MTKYKTITFKEVSADQLDEQLNFRASVGWTVKQVVSFTGTYRPSCTPAPLHDTYDVAVLFEGAKDV